MLYKQELKKILVLIAVGIILAAVFLFKAITTYSGSTIRFGVNDYLILFMIICYPVGIVYGWRQILNLYNTMRRSDREHWARGGGKGYTALMITTINLAFSVIVTLLLGWMIGIINAYNKLSQLKRMGH
ncbi:hypothetical protein [Rossellomorea sp. LjRoot5]|uniref:hypothetical protein n=1 Tax=Rossellomorea sp. LjRoot5 TaxID=3342331 RepID=UPI003ECFF621